jgi:alpha-N-arabinofuranosidase
MKKCSVISMSLLVPALAVQAGTFHVAPNGSYSNRGTEDAPFRTIQHAADLAQPGDIITVHEGIYRERVNPPRGGTSEDNRITYQAAPGEKVVVTGSEIQKNWERVTNDTWRTTIPNSFFGKFNPYCDLIHGDWFGANGRRHHTGAVYLDGDWLTEAAHFENVLAPAGGSPLWFAMVDGVPVEAAEPESLVNVASLKPAANSTLIYAQFPGVNPNDKDVEINVRQTVFTPEKGGVNYLTLRGFDLRDGATPWAPPTAGQIGMVSAYWCKGWIIEDNQISYSTCCGIALGKYSDEWDNRAESAEGYVGTLTRALTHGWNRATVGGHIVRNNHIHHCEQTGVVGSLGCSFSTVTGNVIHDIHIRQLFGGAEMAGIKFHGAIDVEISRNHIYRCGDVSGIWLDWMAQGAHVMGNLLHDNTGVLGDIFLEMQHGPILVANNLLLSKRMSFALNSQGIAAVHNLITGPIQNMRSDTRATPYHRAHSTELAGMHQDAAANDSGDHRLYNNLFVAPCNLHALDNSSLPCFAAGNVFTKGTQPSKFEADALLKPDFDPGVKLWQRADGWYLDLTLDPSWNAEQVRKLVTTELLGKAKVPGCAFENADGSPLRIDTDYFGRKRNEQNPFPGPFELVRGGHQILKVWPVGSTAISPGSGQ